MAVNADNNWTSWYMPVAKERIWHFKRQVTLTSAAAATPQYFVTDFELATLGMTGAVPYVDNVLLTVNGVTLWAVTANVFLQDTAAVNFITYPVAVLLGSAVVFPASAGITLANPYLLQTGGTASKGLQLVGNANGTGSSIVATVWGRYVL